MKESPSLLFRIALFFLRWFRRPYLAAKKRWPLWFEKRLQQPSNLDSSRMLSAFNRLHRFFFERSFKNIRFNENEFQNLRLSESQGPIVFLMRYWGQVEYNYFNDLFLRHQLPLVSHNNKVRMMHWMPWPQAHQLLFRKIDLFFSQGQWPDNAEIFDLGQALKVKNPVLFCLDLTVGSHWLASKHDEARNTLKEIFEAQKNIPEEIQLIPLHFIYDKLPGKSNPSLIDIFFGEKENPGYLRKVVLFLRLYKKRAVARIGTPLRLSELVENSEIESTDNTRALSQAVEKLQRVFDQEYHQVTGPKIKSRKQLVQEILDSPRFKEKFHALIKSEGLPEDATRKKIAQHLKAIASDMNFTVVQLWNYFLHWLFRRFYQGLIVDETGIQKIKDIVKDAPMILVPAHKSHIDYLLLGYVFYHRNLTLPYVCAGDNLAFWPLGGIFRRSGAYFIRRSFAGDKIYTFALKAYVGRLMREGFTQEFFIEGTRSRSGKMFPPKTGMLAMILEAFLERDLKDVYFVPVSMDYDRILEEKSYWREINGEEKQKEKITDLFRLTKFLKKRYGKVYVQFARPISLRESLAADPDLQSTHLSAQPLANFLAPKIGIEIQNITTLLPTSLIAAALLTPKKISWSFLEIEQSASEIWHWTQKKSPRLSELFKEDFSKIILKTIELWKQENFILQHTGLNGIFYTIPETSRLALNFFKNQGLHVWATDSLALLATQTAARSVSSPESNPENIFKLLQQILQREFLFHPQGTVLGEPPQNFSSLLEPILESYWLTLETLRNLQFEKLAEWQLLRKVLENAKVLLLQGRLTYAESISKFNIQNALQQYAKMELLKTELSTNSGRASRLYSKGAKESQEIFTILEMVLRKSHEKN